jgi:hypothetical protein
MDESVGRRGRPLQERISCSLSWQEELLNKREGRIMEEKGLFLALQVAIVYPINAVLNLIVTVIMYPAAVFLALVSPGSPQ